MAINSNGTSKSGREPIAIIGIGCRFPGDANDPASFWQLVSNGVDAITPIPEDRWNIDAFYHPTPGIAGKTYSKWGGFIKGIDQFEPECFGISPREAAYIDPQQRLLLEVAWEALEDGGQVVEQLSGSNTGVFVGIATTDYARIQASQVDNRSIDAHSSTGGAISIAANRISYCLNLNGPSMAVDTACSSSLVATHLACQSIWNHESDMALVGGVNAIIIPQTFIGFCAASMLSPDGRCKAFDASANGFVRSEGAGVVVLKPLSKALADGDRVYAVIASTALNQDGRTSGIAAPSQAAQEALLREACRQAGIAPQDVQYVEAHGTGTEIGDPIEANGLGNALTAGRPPGQPCMIGSIKTNIGHAEAAAGVAGLIKVTLALQHRMIPPSIHFHTPNPRIAFEALQLQVPQRLQPWPERPGPAIAGVNSFGFGGANAHVLLMGHQPASTRIAVHMPEAAARPYLLPLSARTPEALQTLARSYQDFLESKGEDGDLSLADLCHTASTRRMHFDHRLSLAFYTREALLEHLHAFLNGERRPGSATGHRVAGHEIKLVFVCSGQGPQWWGMGRQLLEREPVFRTTIERCDTLLRQHAEWSLLSELMADESHSRLHETAIAQPAIFALQVALAALWKSWGVEPDAVVGHSVGEMAAAHISGALSLEDAVLGIVHRGRCMDRVSSQGKMLAVGLTREEASSIIQGYEDQVSVAAVNSPSAAALSGDPEVLEHIAQSLRERDVFCRFLPVQYAFHSPRMEPVQDELLAALDKLDPRPTTVPMISTVTGQCIDGRELDNAYWWQNVRQCVRFAEAVEQLIEQGANLFVELSPHPVLSGSITECCTQRSHPSTVLPSLRQHEDESLLMVGTWGALYTLGYPVEWSALGLDRGRCVTLPHYPWQHQSYWHEPEALKELRLRRHQRPLLGLRTSSADPSWENVIDKRVFGYLDDHRVREQAVFPAAAYLEMAHGMARDNLGEGPCILEEIQFQRALFLPDGNEAPMVQSIFYPADNAFAIHSNASTSEPSWLQHTIGYLRMPQGLQLPGPVDLEAIRDHLGDEIAPEDYYRAFARIGLNYGPAFQGIERLWRRDGEALGQVRLGDHLAAEAGKYGFHPALLDACFQTFFGAVPQEIAAANPGLYLPVQVGQARFYGCPAQQVWSHARLTTINAYALEGNLWVYNPDGSPVLEVEGFRCQVLQGMRGEDADDVEKWWYDVQWHNKPLPEQQSVQRIVDYLPSSRELSEPVVQRYHQLVKDLDWQDKFADAEHAIDSLCVAYVVHALRELGWQSQEGDRITEDAFITQLQVEPEYRQLVGRFLLMLERANYLSRSDTDAWVLERVPPEQDLQFLWQRTLWRYPALFAELSLMGRCGPNLAEVLRGNVDPLQLLFPEGSTTIAEHFYQDSPHFRLYNAMIQQVMSRALQHLPAERTVRVLEVGAGIGGITTFVLPELPAERTEYVFSDVSPLFLSRAEQKFRDYPFVEFHVLDIEQDPTELGYEPHTFDFILASDVLHATTDLRGALRNLQKLLASDGMLLFLEVVRLAPSWLDMVFGLTEGWWKFRDFDLRPHYPLIAPSTWTELLQQEGYTDVLDLSALCEEEVNLQAVMLARGPHLPNGNLPMASVPDTQPAKTLRESWLVFADESGVSEQLVERLTSNGAACVIATPGDRFHRMDASHFQISPNNPEDMVQLVRAVAASHGSDWCGAIHLWSLDAPPPHEMTLDMLQTAEALGCHCIMHFVQALYNMESAPDSPKLVLVTRNAQPVGQGSAPVSVAQTPLIGLGRIITSEHPDIRCKVVDLGPRATADELQALYAELWTDDPEEEVALRPGARFVPRIERAPVEKVAVAQAPSGGESKLPFRLELVAPGVIDHLTLRQSRHYAPAPGQVEIEVHATALNFRDVMKALALYPTDGEDAMLLGDECAGTIVAVGDGVDNFQVGDEVFAIAPASFGSYVTTLAALVMHKPAHLAFEDAVTMPIVFLTAYYALHHLAHLQAGERVLIQAAAGGVGLAALQIAQHAGAEVFATAGNPEKRDLLRALGVQHVMDSRSTDFADQIMEITNGQGVDIVLNSLAGQALAKGIASLAPYGRFLELGKRDIYQNSKVGLWAFRKNLSLFSIDLSRLIADKPQVAQSLLDELSQRIAEKTYRPLPHIVYPISRIVDAFRYVAQARHTGKVVIAMQDHDLRVEAAQPAPISFRADATYLITGGFGGLGLTVARWIAGHGGRHVVLMSRSGATSDDARHALEALRAADINVKVAKADVTDAQQVADMIADINHTMPPLRGIVHTAMVLDDGILLQLNQERFRQVTSPKIDGTWNLHTQTLGQPLDFFVLFSSATSLYGNQGQGNYVAANTFLDMFAYYRRSLGLPAMAINWGHVAEVGYVSRHQDLADMLTRRGFLSFSPQQAMDVLGRLLQRNPAQMGVMRANWQQVAQEAAQTGFPQRLSSLVGGGRIEQQGSEEGSRIREALQHASAEERREIVETYIREQVARVLGAAADKLDADRPLNELGLDSLMAVELKNRVESALALSLPTRVLMEGPSINRLTDTLLDQQTTPASSTTPVAPPQTERKDDLSARVDQLSDDEVDAFLRELVGEEIGENELAE